MTHGSLFSGIGGFDLAAEWMGWENVFHCEWNEFGKKVLNYYWPNAISYDDITKTDFTIHRGKIDILTGGFPCQPYSAAGKRKGKEDERHLWPEMLRAIGEIQPGWIVGENVLGLVNWSGGLVFEEVCADLENKGYEVQPFILPACAKDAPHQRQRVWFIAKNTMRNGCLFGGSEKTESNDGKQWNTCAGINDGIHLSEGNVADAGLLRQKISKKQTAGIKQCDKGISTDANSKLSQRGGGKNRPEKTIRHFSASFCADTWRNFPTQSPVCSRNDGLSSQLDGITFPKWRAESIKAYGNAIVPQVAFEIFKAISLLQK